VKKEKLGRKEKKGVLARGPPRPGQLALNEERERTTWGKGGGALTDEAGAVENLQKRNVTSWKSLPGKKPFS